MIRSIDSNGKRVDHERREPHEIGQKRIGTDKEEDRLNEQIEAGEEFARDFNEYVPVDAAFWINPAESEKWYFYIASSEIRDDNIRAAYGEVGRRMGKHKSQWLDVFQVKLLNSADRLAAKVIEIRDRYPLKTPMRYNGTSIGGLAIDGAYLYPRITASSSTP